MHGVVFLELRRNSRITSGNSGFLLCWPREVHLRFGLRGKAGECSRVTAGQKRPQLALCSGPNEAAGVWETGTHTHVCACVPVPWRWPRVAAPRRCPSPSVRPPQSARRLPLPPKSLQSMGSDSVRPHRQKPTRLPCPWDSPGKNTGVGCHVLLQGIFPTQGSNPGLSHCRQYHSKVKTKIMHI